MRSALLALTLLALAMRFVFKMKPLKKTLPMFMLAGTAAGAVFFLIPHAAIAYAVWQGAIGLVIASVWTDRRA